MLLKKWIGLFAAAGIVAASAVAGCSSSTTTTGGTGDDGGAGSDAKVTTDAKSDRVVTPQDGSTGGCTPQAVTNASSPTPAYKPYLKSAACTTTQLSTFYTQCVDDAATQTTCGAWENDANNAGCEACLITPANQANWGPIVAVANRDLPFNIAGCFGITLNEGASTTGCGAARWAFDRCLRSACPIANCCADTANCTPAEEQAFTDCRAQAFAAGGTCEQVATDLNTKCAGLDDDAAQGRLEQNCPLGDNVSLQQFTIAITTAFCGGGTGDGGGGG